jgi:hypothetical protein
MKVSRAVLETSGTARSRQTSGTTKMTTPSPRQTVSASIMMVASMSLLLGVMLMAGVHKLSLHDSSWIATLATCPLLILAAALHIRRILKAIP